MSYLEKNKRINRREFLRVSALGATGALLAACGAGAIPQVIEKEVVVTKEVEKIVEVTSVPSGAQVTVLSFGHHWEAAFQPTQEGWDNKFMEQHPEIVLKRTYNSWADHNNIVPTWAAAHTLPDIIYVHGSRAFPWAHEGITISVQDYIDSDQEFDVKGIWEEALRLYRYEGKQHDIPYDHGPLLLGYNKDIFDAAGQPYPDENWTMEDLLKAATALADVENQRWGWGNVTPFLIPGHCGATLRPWGADLMNEDQTKLTLDTPEAKEAIQWWADMIHKHKVALNMEEAAGVAPVEFAGAAPFRAGVAAMDLVASWDTPSLFAQATFKWDVAPWPSGPKGKGTGSFGSGFGITSDSKNPDAGWAYLREYLSTQGMVDMWGSTGRGSPARKEAYDSWLQSGAAPEHGEYFLDALENYAITDPPFATLAAAEIIDIMVRECNLIKIGDKSAEDALAAMMTDGTAALAKVSG